MLPKDIINIISDYVVSMRIYEIKTSLHQELKRVNLIQHLKAFHTTTRDDGDFCPFFCLAVLKYMNSDAF